MLKIQQDTYDELFSFLKTDRAFQPVSLNVVGDVGIDQYIFGAVDRISPEAPVPVLWKSRSEAKLACAANVVECLEGLYAEQEQKLSVELVSVLGKDDSALQFKKLIKSCLCQLTDSCFQDESRSTTLKTRFIAGNHHQLLRLDEEDVHALSDELTDKIISNLKNQLELNNSDFFILEDYAKGMFTEKMYQSLIALLNEKKVPYIIDPHVTTSPEFMQGAFFVKPNLVEAERYLGYSLDRGRSNEVVVDAARKLKKKYQWTNCLITRAAFGMTLVDQDDQVFHFPAVAREVFDSTGAGDMVVAAIALSLARKKSLAFACWLATLASAVVVTKVGAAKTNRDEILKLLSQEFQTS